MNTLDAIKTRRSIRKFQKTPIKEETLLNLVDCARLAPYPANLQPLKFAIISEPEQVETMFAYTKWAGYLENGAPLPEERPVAYLVILGDTTIKSNQEFKVETGIAGSHIVLGAMDYGIATCWLGALDRTGIAELLQLPENLMVQDAIALGYPAQESRAVPLTDSVKYYLNQEEVLQVPKRSRETVIYNVRRKSNAF